MVRGRRNNAESGGRRNSDGGETTSGYFRRLFSENPKLLNAGSNTETLDRWLKDHPGYKTAPNNVKANLANIKSVVRKERRRRGRREDAELAVQPNAGAATPVRRSGH